MTSAAVCASRRAGAALEFTRLALGAHSYELASRELPSRARFARYAIFLKHACAAEGFRASACASGLGVGSRRARRAGGGATRCVHASRAQSALDGTCGRRELARCAAWALGSTSCCQKRAGGARGACRCARARVPSCLARLARRRFLAASRRTRRAAAASGLTCSGERSRGARLACTRERSRESSRGTR